MSVSKGSWLGMVQGVALCGLPCCLSGKVNAGFRRSVDCNMLRHLRFLCERLGPNTVFALNPPPNWCCHVPRPNEEEQHRRVAGM